MSDAVGAGDLKSATLNVLLVEDNPGDADLIREMLPASGPVSFSISHFQRLADARKGISEDAYDVILLDLGLPDSQGIDTVTSLHDIAPGLPVIVLTGNTDRDMAMAAVRSGCQDYLLKGAIDEAQLVRSIQYAVERKKAEKEIHLHEMRLADLLTLHRMEDATEKEILDFSLDACLKTTQSAYAFIGFMDDDESALLIHTWSQKTMNECSVSDKPIHFPIEKAGLWGEAVRRRRPLLVNDYEASGEPKKGYPAGHVPITRLLSVPVFRSGRIVLVAAVANKAAGYTPSDVSALTTLLHEMWNLIERRRANILIREHEEELNAIYDHAPFVMMLVDGERRITKVNNLSAAFVQSSAADMLGLRSGEALRCINAFDDEKGCGFGINCRECVIRRAVKDTFETGKSFHQVETALLFAEGEDIRKADVLISTSRLNIGKQPMVLLTLLDISSRKRAEEELKASEERFRRAIEGAPFPIMIHNEEGNVLFLNRAWTEITGYSREELPTVYEWAERAYGASREKVMKKIDRLFTMERYEEEGDYTVTCRDGSQRIWTFSSAPLGAMAEGKKAVITMAIDVTEHRKTEEQLHQSQKMEAVGLLAGGVAHDFNNILAAMTNYLHLMKISKSDTRNTEECVDQLSSLIDRAAALTRGLLTFGRKQKADPKPLNIVDVISRVHNLFSRVLEENIEIRLRLPGRPVMVLADSLQMEQVFMNLATNARDAMPQGGVLTIGMELMTMDDSFISAHGFGTPGEYVLLMFSDSGTGMDDLTTARIFEPFFTTKDTGKGTGLGLSIVYGIIKQHNGFISVSSEEGRGTTFGIYLPLMEGSEEERPASAVQIPPRGKGETVLLAEDEENLRRTTSKILEEFGYRVITAVNGADAVEKFRQNSDSIGLLLFDVIMPKMNGKVAYEEIRTLRPGIRVVFMSGYAEDLVLGKSLVSKEDLLVNKPVSPLHLLKKIRDVIDS